MKAMMARLGGCLPVFSILAFLVLVPSATPAEATTYYFSDCAVGGAGTQANPYCLDPAGTGNPISFKYLMDGVAPDVTAGDTIDLCAGPCDGTGTGTYHLGVSGTTNMGGYTYAISPVVSGTQSAPITIQSFPGETVILSGDTNGDGIPQATEPDILITNTTDQGRDKAWYVWKNLIFEKVRTIMFYLNANPANWTFDNIEVRYFSTEMWNGGSVYDVGCTNQTGGYVFKLADLAASLTIRNSRFHHICGAVHRHTVNQSTSANFLAENNEYYNVSVVTNNFQGGHETWRGNYLHDFIDGITIEDDMKYVTIEDNIAACWGDYKQDFDGRCLRAITIDDGDNGPATAGMTHDIIVRRNRVYGHVDGQYGGTNIGYFLCAMRFIATNNTQPINVVIENNMVWHHYTWESTGLCEGGIGVSTNRNEVTIQNNTIYDTTIGMYLDGTIAGVSYTVRNNLIIRANKNGQNNVEMWIAANAANSVLRNNNINDDGQGDPVMTVGTTNYGCAQIAAYQSGNNKCARTTFVRTTGAVNLWDLHLLPTDTVNKDAGIPGPADDIDKEPRTGIVDIGADELTPGLTAALVLTTGGQAPPASGGNYLLKAGTYTVQLTISKSIVGLPGPMVFTDSGGGIASIVLAGTVPGTVFTGTFTVGSSTAEGVGSFSLPTGTLNDGAGGTGNQITSGRTALIDRTPPAAPTGLRTL